jgi:hypothetical protein
LRGFAFDFYEGSKVRSPVGKDTMNSPFNLDQLSRLVAVEPFFQRRENSPEDLTQSVRNLLKAVSAEGAIVCIKAHPSEFLNVG